MISSPLQRPFFTLLALIVFCPFSAQAQREVVVDNIPELPIVSENVSGEGANNDEGQLSDILQEVDDLPPADMNPLYVENEPEDIRFESVTGLFSIRSPVVPIAEDIALKTGNRSSIYTSNLKYSLPETKERAALDFFIKMDQTPGNPILDPNEIEDYVNKLADETISYYDSTGAKLVYFENAEKDGFIGKELIFQFSGEADDEDEKGVRMRIYSDGYTRVQQIAMGYMRQFDQKEVLQFFTRIRLEDSAYEALPEILTKWTTYPLDEKKYFTISLPEPMAPYVPAQPSFKAGEGNLSVRQKFYDPLRDETFYLILTIYDYGNESITKESFDYFVNGYVLSNVVNVMRKDFQSGLYTGFEGTLYLPENSAAPTLQAKRTRTFYVRDFYGQNFVFTVDVIGSRHIAESSFATYLIDQFKILDKPIIAPVQPVPTAATE